MIKILTDLENKLWLAEYKAFAVRNNYLSFAVLVSSFGGFFMLHFERSEECERMSDPLDNETYLNIFKVERV